MSCMVSVAFHIIFLEVNRKKNFHILEVHYVNLKIKMDSNNILCIVEYTRNCLFFTLKMRGAQPRGF